MRVYMIKRNTDGLFYVNINGHYSTVIGRKYEHWSDKGRFFRTPDGVAGNLRKLCSDPFYDTTRPPGLSPNIKDWKELSWRHFDASKLDEYSVIVMDIDVINMTALPVSEFAQVEAIERTPLTRAERKAVEVAA